MLFLPTASACCQAQIDLGTGAPGEAELMLDGGHSPPL